MGFSWQGERCGSCGRRLHYHEEGERRHVPERGGRELPVCPACARSIDAQQQLDVDPGEAA